MAVKTYPITGVASRVPQPRRNINDFVKDPLQWNLFLQAMINFQSQGEDTHSPLGYYQVAGIHGTPYVAWLEEVDADDRAGDYCTHGTALFLTWHRPYLLLLEQRIVEEALTIAKSFSIKYRAEYEEAALKIRIPYWDWATDSDVPQSIRFPKTDITLPQVGSDAPPVTQRDVPNPMYSYGFKTSVRRQRDFSIIGVREMVAWEETTRCPDGKGISHPEIVDLQLRTPPENNPGIPNCGSSFRDPIFKLLTLVGSYGAFGNTGWQTGSPGANNISLEHYHNIIHNFTGTNYIAEGSKEGHMTEVATAAFDPIFWLHHCNIDRMYALWQAIHYEAPFEDQTTDYTRMPLTKAIDDASTTLRPFYKDERHTVPWTSSMIQKSGAAAGPTVFDYNYRYPELSVELSGPGMQREMASYVLKQVHKLYGPPSTDESLVDIPKVPRDLLPPSRIVQRGKFRREWLIFLRVRKYLIPGNFIIFFFLGEAGDDPHQWLLNENRVGVVSTFKSTTDICGNCAGQEEADQLLSGGVDITNALYNKLASTGLALDDQGEMESWLTENLKWRILKQNDKTELTSDELRENPDNLFIGVKSFVLLYPTDELPADGEEFLSAPKIIDEKIHFSVTEPQRRHGGLGRQDPY
ncbi:tyrosinase [Tuber magnatum]|uniref:tyrosinase n=1 Tax=Tuber magnatum TaxID=42249 RepID=A0A317SFD2_9PEZI|nr:tyrosinase [Tuber magnatum]